jgi:hypothetical protein
VRLGIVVLAAAACSKKSDEHNEPLSTKNASSG